METFADSFAVREGGAGNERKNTMKTKCPHCGSENTVERPRGRTAVMYNHAKCEDCKKVFFLTDSHKTAYCGSPEEHWKQLA